MLSLIKTVDLINEANRPFPVFAVLLGFLHNLADVFNAACYRGEGNKVGLRPVGNDSGEGGFAHAGWSPKDQR